VRKKEHQMLIMGARELRRKMTSQERQLWHGFLQKHPSKFYRQRVFDRFIVDFYCASAKLVIEIDGSQHCTTDGKKHDLERNTVLEALGLRVIRFSNYQVNHNFAQVCQEIDRQIKENNLPSQMRTPT
jgi:very-short-patch-repair endonuclease